MELACGASRQQQIWPDAVGGRSLQGVGDGVSACISACKTTHYMISKLLCPFIKTTTALQHGRAQVMMM